MKLSKIVIMVCVVCMLLQLCKKRMPMLSLKRIVRYNAVNEPELLLKVKDAKDTIEKLDTSKLTGVLSNTRERAYATLDSVFEKKYDNYKDIEQTRAGVETFVGRR